MNLNLSLLKKAAVITKNRPTPINFGARLKKRRLNAITKAFERLIENPYIDFQAGKLLILSDSRDLEANYRIYETTAEDCRLVYPENHYCRHIGRGFRAGTAQRARSPKFI